MFTKIFNSDPYGRGLINASVRLPSRIILDMIKNCRKQYDTIPILDNIICDHMGQYLHSHIGLQLDENTIGTQITEEYDVQQGNLVSHTDHYGNKILAIYNIKDDGNHEIIQRKNNIIIRTNVTILELEKINQTPNQLNSNLKTLRTDLNQQPLAHYKL